MLNAALFSPTSRVRLLTVATVLIAGDAGFVHWRQAMEGTVVAESKCPSGHGIVRVRAMPDDVILALLFIDGDGYWYRCEFYSDRDERLYSAKSYASHSYEARSIQIEWTARDDATVIFDGGGLRFRCNQGDWEY